MELVYVYVERFRNIRHQEVNFSDEVSCRYSHGRLFIQRCTPDPAKAVIFKDSLLGRVSLIVGKTGAGKTNFLQLIGMPEYSRSDSDRFFLVFRRRGAYKHRGNFFIELHNMKLDIPVEEAPSVVSLPNSGLFKANLDGNQVSSLTPLRQESFRDLLIVNCFDKNAFTANPYPDDRKDDFNRGHWFIPRHLSPYGSANIGIACDYIKRYLNDFPKTSVKWDAALEIKSQNWAKRYNSPVDKILLESQYWTYSERKWDVEITHRKPQRSKLKSKSAKQMFLHDLLADFALYLREFLEAEIKMELEQEADIYDEIGVITEFSNRPNPFHSPDHWGKGSTGELLTRIEWLAMLIDRSENGDLFPDGHGVVWQLSSDIKDIYHILKRLPEKYFTLEKFSIPIKEINTGKGEPMEELFERMTGYIPDDSGLFPQELLPYRYTCLSSGEYQYAKVLGAIDEYCVQLKLQNPHTKSVYYPDFILLLDEPETYMHPELSRRFLHELNEVLKRHRGRSSVQVIMTSHSPFMLSDLLPWQITTLDYDEQGLCKVVERPQATFGAEIHSILAHDFFLRFTIGEYSRQLLSSMLERLRAIVEKEQPQADARTQQLSEADARFIEEVRLILPNIGDPLIRSYFSSLLSAIEINSQTKEFS